MRRLALPQRTQVVAAAPGLQLLASVPTAPGAPVMLQAAIEFCIQALLRYVHASSCCERRSIES